MFFINSLYLNKIVGMAPGAHSRARARALSVYIVIVCIQHVNVISWDDCCSAVQSRRTGTTLKRAQQKLHDIYQYIRVCFFFRIEVIKVAWRTIHYLNQLNIQIDFVLFRDACSTD